MDIEKLAVDANEEVGNEIISGVLEENTTEGINPKGFLLDESDVLLFQKELHSKETNSESLILAENLKTPFNGKENLQKLLSKEEKQLIETPEDKRNSLIEKAFNQATFSETKKTNDKAQVRPSENAVGVMVTPGQSLAIDAQDKSLNLTNKSENIKANDAAYEIKAMPIEIAMDPSKVITRESVNLQTPSTVENVVRTHSEIIYFELFRPQLQA